MAPEIFRNKKYSKESDIYSLGMIMWELMTGRRPFWDHDHNVELLIFIWDGLRPVVTEDTPECFANLVKQCWDSDPSKRPSIKKIRETVGGWYYRNINVEQFNQAEEKRSELIKLKKLGPEFTVKHSGAIYTSRSLSSHLSNTSQGTYYIIK